MNTPPTWANRRLRLILTSECNIACAYCHNEGQPKGTDYFPESLLNRLLSILGDCESQLDAVTFSGGEPLLHPYLFRFAKAIRPYARRMAIVSNGLLMDRACVVALQNSGIDHVRLGVDSLWRENSRPTPGTAPTWRVRRTMDLLWAINLPFELNIVLTRYNIAELPRMLTFCQSHKLSAKFFEHVSLRYEHNSQNLTFVPVPHFGLSQFLEVASEVFGADCFVKCPEYGEANYVYSTGAYTLRYCRYLCPFGLCYKTGTRVDARGFVCNCLPLRGEYSQ